MNLVRATHQLAIEMSVLARYSLAKGHQNNAIDYYKQAFQWERKAAFMTTPIAEDKDAHFILLRSAAALAFKAELYAECERLIEICLAEHPPLFIQEDIEELITLIQEKSTSPKNIKITPTTDNIQIEGLLTKVDAEENEITIKDDSRQLSYAIIVSKEQLSAIIKDFWFQKVHIKARQTSYGVMVLEKIKAAA